MLVGGFYVSRRELRQVDEAVAKAKQEFNLPLHAPVKWNLKDPACAEAKKVLGNRVDDFRSDLFGRVQGLDVRLLMSLVWKGDPSYRLEAWKWWFENILQRLCIILDRKKRELSGEHEYPFLDVVFDWLPGHTNIDGYFNVYSTAYHQGYQFIRNRLPALKACEACPSLLVTSARHSPALQVTDMVLGAVGDFFAWVFKQQREGSVRRHFVSLYDLFHRSDNGTVVGTGLVVKANTRKRIRNALNKLGLKP